MYVCTYKVAVYIAYTSNKSFVKCGDKHVGVRFSNRFPDSLGTDLSLKYAPHKIELATCWSLLDQRSVRDALLIAC